MNEIRDFGQRSFVRTTGLIERIQKMNEQELLAVLDMSEDEQDRWCALNTERKSHEHLADLAFKLRNEVVGRKIEGVVPNYFDEKVVRIKFPQSLFRWFNAKRLIDEKLKTYLYPGNRESWWNEQSQPIHWIIAALIAKGKR